MDLIGDRLDQRFQKAGRGQPIGFTFESGEGDLRGAVDRHEQIELSFFGSDLGDIDVKEAYGIGLEPLFTRFVAFMSGRRLIPCRCKQRCNDERVRCGIVACNA